ncbi:unnamed protein product [Fusarium graminearum]|nr:unnamed protein product [Fusarium graminearum]
MSVGGIDAFLYTAPNCPGRFGGLGSYFVCTNLRRNTCCGIDIIDSPIQSVGLYNIGDGFTVRMLAYNGGNCTNPVAWRGNSWGRQICISDMGYRYTGCDYSFGLAKRDASRDKVGCQRPDVLVIPDGTEYDLSRLSDDNFEQILGSDSQVPSPSTTSMTADAPVAYMETTKQRSRRPAYTTVAWYAPLIIIAASCVMCCPISQSDADPRISATHVENARANAVVVIPVTVAVSIKQHVLIRERRDIVQDVETRKAISRSTTDAEMVKPVRQQRDPTNDVSSDCSGASSAPLRSENFDYYIRLGENNFGSVINDATRSLPGTSGSNVVGVDQIRRAIEYRTVGSIGGALGAFNMETWIAVLQLWDEEVGLQYPLLNVRQLLEDIDAAKQDAASPKLSPGTNHQYAADIAFLVLAVLSCIKDASAVEVADPAIQELYGTVLVQVHTGQVKREPLVLLLLTAVYSFLVDREVLAWRTTGTVLRLLQELDCEDGNGHDNEIDDRFFWTVYTLDRRWSFGTGLPFALSDTDITRKTKPDLTIKQDGSISSAYLHQMISYCGIASDVRKSLLSPSPSAASSTSTRDFLEFRVLQWQQNLPERLRFQGPQDIFDSSKETRGEYRLRLLLYLRANQMRIVIHRKFATRSEMDPLGPLSTRTMIEVAQATIHVLLAVARETDIYYAQHKTFNHFLETALSSLLLVMCSPEASNYSSCLTDVFMAMEFIGQLAKRSPISEKLKNKLQGIQQLIFEANGQSLRPSHVQKMARDTTTLEAPSQINNAGASMNSEPRRSVAHLEQGDVLTNPLSTWPAVHQLPLQQPRSNAVVEPQAETIVLSPTTSGPKPSQPIWINYEGPSNLVVAADQSSPVQGVSFESVPRFEGLWPLPSTDPSGSQEMDFTSEDLAIFRSPDMAEILKDYDSFFF